MTISIIATAGADDANSYVTAAEMATWVGLRPVTDAETAWAALSADDKARYLIQAAKQIDRSHRWVGQRLTDVAGNIAGASGPQALEFPRLSFLTRQGKVNLDGPAAPAVDARVKEAQMEQALYLCYQVAVAGGPAPLGGSVRAQLQAEGVTSISIGNTSETYGKKAMALCNAAEELLRPLIRRSTSI